MDPSIFSVQIRKFYVGGIAYVAIIVGLDALLAMIFSYVLRSPVNARNEGVTRKYKKYLTDRTVSQLHK
jgi:hypothetical protein